MNTWCGIGNLGQDPDLRTTPSGRSVLNLSLAVDRFYYQGEGSDRKRVSITDWIPVVVWGQQAEHVSRWLQKGSQIAVRGTLRPRQYQDQNGNTQRVFEIIAEDIQFLAKIKTNEQRSRSYNQSP